MKLRTARLLVVALCTSTLVSASPAAQTTGAGKHFLWTVRSDANVLYLAGSVHALSADAYPLPAVFEKAFEASGTLVEELDLADATSVSAMPMLLAKGVYSDGRTLEGAVSKETAAMAAQHFKQTGLPLEMLSRMKPWMVMLMLTALQLQKAGLDASLGVDKYFYDKAVAAKPFLDRAERSAKQQDPATTVKLHIVSGRRDPVQLCRRKRQLHRIAP